MSNIDEIANSISTTSCKLVYLWNNGNYQDKVKLQKLVFPEGVLWDKVNESFRTLKINRVFDVIHSLTDNYNDKKERSDNEIAPLSHLVETLSGLSNKYVKDYQAIVRFIDDNIPSLNGFG